MDLNPLLTKKFVLGEGTIGSRQSLQPFQTGKEFDRFVVGRFPCRQPERTVFLHVHKNCCHLPCVFQFESSICQPAPRHKLDRVRKATIRLHNNDKPSFLAERVIDLDSCERKQAHADRQNNPRPGRTILGCDVEIILKVFDHGSTRSLANTRCQSSGELTFSKIPSAMPAPAKRSLVITSTRKCGKMSMIADFPFSNAGALSQNRSGGMPRIVDARPHSCEEPPHQV